MWKAVIRNREWYKRGQGFQGEMSKWETKPLSRKRRIGILFTEPLVTYQETVAHYTRAIIHERGFWVWKTTL